MRSIPIPATSNFKNALKEQGIQFWENVVGAWVNTGWMHSIWAYLLKKWAAYTFQTCFLY